MNHHPLLKISDLSSGYGDMNVLHEVSFHAEAGTVTAVAGSNGAGKTTLLKSILGVLPLTSGTVWLGERDVTRTRVPDRIAAGLGLVPEGRGLFVEMSVRENLRLGGRASGLRRAELRSALDEALEVFPVLSAKLHDPAGSLSGGQQQMLAVARALVARPRVLLLDEPSMGLAPLIWAEILTLARRLADDGCAVILAEQKIRPVLAISDRCLVLRRGDIVFDGTAAGEEAENSINEAYMEAETTGATTHD